MPVYISIISFIFGMMIFFGVLYPQPPFSDFEIHWNQSQSIETYIKGGLSAFIYMGVSNILQYDWLSALFVNLTSWICFVLAILPFSLRGSKSFCTCDIFEIYFAAALFFFGIWWVSVASTVALFPLHLAVFAWGLRLALLEGPRLFLYSISSVLLLTVAFSMRMQTVLAVFIGVCFMGIFMLFRYVFFKEEFFHEKRSTVCRFFFIAGLAIVLGVGAEALLRFQSVNDAEIVRSQRAQFYNGLFDPFSEPAHCGGWNQQNWDLAFEERAVPLSELFDKYVSDRSLIFFVEAALCKYKRLIKTEVYVWWVPRINYLDWKAGSVIHEFPLLYQFIVVNNILLKLCIFALVFYCFFEMRGRKSIATSFLTAILVGLIIAIGLLELNTRYAFLIVGYFLVYCRIRYETTAKI